MSLWTRNPTQCSCLSPFPLKKTLCPSSVVVLPKFFHLISQSPKLFHLYLSILCVNSWNFPAALCVPVFYVPIVMLSLPRIFDDAPVAYLTPPSWCPAEGTVLVDPGGYRSGMVWLLVSIIWWVTGRVIIIIIMEIYAAPKLSKYMTALGAYNVKSFTFKLINTCTSTPTHPHTYTLTHTHTHTHTHHTHECAHARSDTPAHKHVVRQSRYNLTEPTPLQVEHVAVELIAEPFRPSGPCLWRMKIPA